MAPWLGGLNQPLRVRMSTKAEVPSPAPEKDWKHLLKVALV